jgi:molybdenum cofactor biosynthesis enzyme MoaA
MDTNQIIQKIINGKVFLYDKKYDTIHLSDNATSYVIDTSEVSVEICHEVTISCNHFCNNCFSNSGGKGGPSNYRDFSALQNTIALYRRKIIRNCITGGEPFAHPHIKKILDLPALFPDCGFVIITNGTLKSQFDASLIDNKWCTIISLHGRQKAHNQYTNSNSFKMVTDRITKLASNGYVNIYTVLNDYLTRDDITWLLKFRDEVGVGQISFLKPRPFGRFAKFNNEFLLNFIEEIQDNKTRIRYQKSNIPFVDINGIMRRSN